jgi:hypothetical protein
MACGGEETPTSLAGATTVTTDSPPDMTLMVSLPSQGPVFGEETGILLLFDDGYDGLTAFDPDRRLAGRSIVEGQRAGDEEYSMIRVGDTLVVGWGEPYAIDIASRQATSLGAATFFVPAAEPNRVWMIDYGDRIGDHPPQVWQVDVTSGPALQDPVPLAGGYPLIGIPGGLALQTDTGLDLWTLETGEIIALEAEGGGFAHDIYEEALVWCAGDCTSLLVTNTSTGATQQHDPPAGFDMFFWGASRFSPDGRHLAALLGQEGTQEGRGIWLLDRDTGDTTVVSDPTTYVYALAWAPDGAQLFANSYSYRESLTAVWRYDLTDQRFAAVVVPFGGALRSTVVVDASIADAYFDTNLVDPSECRAPTMQPSRRSGICTFGF